MTIDSRTEATSHQQIRPERITRPIQLLAAWLTGLVLVDGMFLSAAAILQHPSWLPATLVIAAILNIPVFLTAIFLLQTRFRPEMQEDAYYAEYLKESNYLKSSEKELRYRVESSGLLAKQRQQEAMQYFDGTLVKLDIDQSEANRLRQAFREAIDANEDRAIEDLNLELLGDLKSFFITAGTESMLSSGARAILLKGVSHLRQETLASRESLLAKDLTLIDVASSIRRICQMLSPMAQRGQKEVDVTISGEPLKALATRGILETAFTEIMANALAYSPNGSSIRVMISGNPDDGVNIDVRNPVTQAVVERTNMGKVFEPGYRGDESTRLLPEGSGMGLSTVQRLFRLVNGTVKAELEGATFKVQIRLPTTKRSTQE